MKISEMTTNEQISNELKDEADKFVTLKFHYLKWEILKFR